MFDELLAMEEVVSSEELEVIHNQKIKILIFLILKIIYMYVSVRYTVELL